MNSLALPLPFVSSSPCEAEARWSSVFTCFICIKASPGPSKILQGGSKMTEQDEMQVLPDSTVDDSSLQQTSTSFPMMMPPSSSASGNSNAPGSSVHRIVNLG